ncbi:MAG: NIL domain-containing protein [Oculatellaceae cyanobacterium bins.114]|nr:NIL domain-containing protein [Oculatellaceae cyanobacterium bins.114]
MVSQYCNSDYSASGLTAPDLLNPAQAIADIIDDNRLIQTQIRLQIPKNFHREPIISRLISEHRIAVNVTSAPTGTNPRCDRWFTLELRGKVKQVRSALAYLKDTKPEVL